MEQNAGVPTKRTPLWFLVGCHVAHFVAEQRLRLAQTIQLVSLMYLRGKAVGASYDNRSWQRLRVLHRIESCAMLDYKAHSPPGVISLQDGAWPRHT